MQKLNIGTNAFLMPMPMVIVGSHYRDRPNFMAVAWASRVNAKPAVFGIALGRRHATTDAIRAGGEFSINIPSVDLLQQTDLVGIAGGKEFDKSGLFEIFYGSLKKAPMIAPCPVCFECSLLQSVDLADDTLFLGEVKGLWTEDRFLTGGIPDVEKVRPFCLTMPDNRYWTIGASVGRAWHDGLALRDGLPGLSAHEEKTKQ